MKLIIRNYGQNFFFANAQPTVIRLIVRNGEGGGSTGGGGITVSAGTQSNSLSNLVFSNANSVSFGLSGSTITAAFSQSTQSQSNQNISLYALGNTTQNSSTILNASNLSFNGLGNVSIGFSNGSVQVSQTGGGGAGGAAISAGANSQNTGTIVFSNDNGITFGLSNNGTFTASVRTDYQSSGNYLTTAMQSNAGSNFVGLNSALTANGLSATINSSGISLNVPAYLTTAQPVGAYLTTARASNDAIGLNTAITQNGVSMTANSSGLSLNFPAFLTTAQSTGNYLTTAAQSNQVVNSLNGSTGQLSLNVGSSLSASTNGSSITFGLASNITTALQSTGAYLTTAAQSNQVVNSINGATGVFSFATGSSLSSSVNGNSITWGLASNITTALQSTGAYLTTAAQSNQVVNSINGSTGIFSFNTGSSLSSSRNGNSITWGLASDISTAFQTAGAYLTTAAQSNQVINSINGSTGIFSFNTGSSLSSSRNGNSITWGLASNITTALQSAGAYLTTARASTDAVGLNSAQSNVTWTINSSGLSFDARGYAGTGFTSAGANVTINATHNSIGLNLSISAGTVVAVPIVFSAGANSASLSSIVLSNSNNIAFGLNGSTITASASNNRVSYFDNMGNFGNSNQSAVGSKAMQASTLWIFPLSPGDVFPGDLTASTLWLNVAISGSSNTMSSAQTSNFTVGIYTINANQTQLGLASSATYNWSTNAGNANYSTIFAGNRWLAFTKNNWGGSTEPIFFQNSKYFAAFLWSSAGQVNNVSNALFGNFAFSTAARSGTIGASTANSTWLGFYPAMGHYSANTVALPANIGVSEVNKQVSSANFMPQVVLNAMSNLTQF